MGIDDIIQEKAPNQQAQQEPQPSSDSDTTASSDSGIDIESMLQVGDRQFTVEELIIGLLLVDITLTLVLVSRLSRQVVR